MGVVKSEKCLHCCATGSRVDHRQVTLPVFGEEVTVDAETRVCSECGEENFDPDFERATLRRAYERYRERFRTVTAAEVAAVRKEYGLSQRALAALLGCEDTTIHRYESGKPIRRAHSDALRNLAASG